MPKDSQVDNKQKRMEKCNYQTPLTAEAQNHNRSTPFLAKASKALISTK